MMRSEINTIMRRADAFIRQCGFHLPPFAYWTTMSGKLYAEKLMVVEVDQLTPLHFHYSKMEDIINRSGGTLAIECYQAGPEESLDSRDITVSIDSVQRTVRAGGTIELRPGESITLPPHCYHQFVARGSRVLVGEVSMVNDDLEDNRFHALSRGRTSIAVCSPGHPCCISAIRR